MTLRAHRFKFRVKGFGAMGFGRHFDSEPGHFFRAPAALARRMLGFVLALPAARLKFRDSHKGIL